MVTKLEKLKSQLHASKEAYKLCDDERSRLDEELIIQREGYEESIVCLQQERDELKRKNDDLAIANADYEMQIKQLRETANESHEEAVQLSRQLHQLKQSYDTVSSNGRVWANQIDRAIEACDQYLFVEFGITKDTDRKGLSQVQRFVLYVRDVLSKV